MLHLQRASAGSGKTYLLAKKFIWYFLTKESGGKKRLRTPVEMTDSLDHILAITFTNKATAEMKQRIVDKLAAIAAYRPGSGMKHPDYLDDFVAESGASEEKIVELAGCGLDVLLNYYSDFNVSTIDSFFQSVLRTFAYEADLNDTYEVELDSDYLARVSIDGLLEEIGKKNPDNRALFWVRLLMQRDGVASWNIFAKNEGTYGDTLYSRMLSTSKRLDTEDYKRIKPELDEYFRKNPDPAPTYIWLEKRYCEVLQTSVARLSAAAEECAAVWAAHGIDVEKEGVYRLASHIVKCRQASWDSSMSVSAISRQLGFKQLDLNGRMSRSKISFPADVEEELRVSSRKMYDAHDDFMGLLNSPEIAQWRLYRDQFPYLCLLELLRRKRSEFLEDNNLVELSETNSMLSEIIGDDDVPFIYERLGSKLHHFLIDEFQDTSRMQWNNLSMLVRESESHDYSNLIIGDAKQSIYRFRNADSSLITKTVPESFGNVVIGGGGEAENANWRSRRRVVEFNNFIFERMAAVLAPTNRAVDFSTVYSNVCQKPMAKGDDGYVEVRVYKETDMADETACIIEDLIERGCRQRDIAVLVSTRGEAESVIASIVSHNEHREDGSGQISFIGEQTLRIDSSKAVSIIISALGALAEGRQPEFREGEERRREGAAEWADIKCNFRFFALRHPELSVAEQVEMFLREGSSEDELAKVVADMHSVTLPSLVEAIAEAFVDPSCRDAEAQFVSSFQDVVLQYCSRYPTDISSFLSWWENNKQSLSISVPEDIDAVQVMTIHKSKGLEFKYVILPYIHQKFGEAPNEWRWVSSEGLLVPGGGELPEGMSLPPYIPINTANPDVAYTEHSSLAEESRGMCDMDILNRLYVAFTRAVDELYVLASAPGRMKSGAMAVSDLLVDFITGNIADGNYRQKAPAYTLESNDCCDVYSVGEKDSVTVADEDAQEEDLSITEYYVNSGRELLRYKEEGDLLGYDGDGEDNDPRSEGNLLHEVMSLVERREDLDYALVKMRMRGLITRSEAESFRMRLGRAMDREEVRSWFDGSQRIFSERNLMSNKTSMSRPDRMMVDSEGNLTIVDYKFGTSSSHSKYERQLRRYVKLLEGVGGFRSFSAYIWYIAEDRIEKVEIR